MRQFFILGTLASFACVTASNKPASTQEETPLVEWRHTAQAAVGTFDATLRHNGLQDTLFISANGAGTVVAAMLDSNPPGLVAVMRQRGDEWQLEVRQGSLLEGTAPLLGFDDEVGDDVKVEDLTTGAKFTPPRRLTAIDAGITDGPALKSGCCGWWEHTIWRVPAQETDRVLVRAAVAKLGTWTVLDAYVPGQAAPQWRIKLRDADGPARVADAQLTPRGDQLLVQLTDHNEHAQLVAYAMETGTELWRVRTADTRHGSGALVVTDDGLQVITVLANPRACETCEKLEVHDVATGRLLRNVPLRGETILGRYGKRGYELMLGVSGNRLWLRAAARGGDSHSMRVAACTYDSWDLHDGSSHEATAELRESLKQCDAPLRIAPVAGGVIGMRATDTHRAELIRLRRAP